MIRGWCFTLGSVKGERGSSLLSVTMQTEIQFVYVSLLDNSNDEIQFKKPRKKNNVLFALQVGHTYNH